MYRNQELFLKITPVLCPFKMKSNLLVWNPSCMYNNDERGCTNSTPVCGI